MRAPRNNNEPDADGPFVFGNDPDDDSTDAEVTDEIDLGDEEEDYPGKPQIPEELEDEEEYEEPSPPPKKADAARQSSAVRDGPRNTERPARPLKPLDFESALRIVDLKLRFWKYFFLYVISGAMLVGINAYLVNIGSVNPWWVEWPLILYGLFLVVPFFRAYLFKGKDLKAILQDRIHRMAEREIEKREADLYEE